MYDFTGKTVAITGGAGILGGEIAHALAGCGAKVAILDVNAEAGKTLIEGFGERGKQLKFFKCDVLIEVKSGWRKFQRRTPIISPR